MSLDLEGEHFELLQYYFLHRRPHPYYRYEGPLATPARSEGVHWMVSAEKLQMSSEQLAPITSHLHQNNRPLQPLVDREIALVSP